MYKKVLLVGLLLGSVGSSRCASSDMRYINRALITCKYQLMWGAEDCGYRLGSMARSMGNVVFSICMWMKGFLTRLIEDLCSMPAVALRECGYLLSGY